nr:hypothetical protein [Acidobacteriota bacterium]
MQAKLTSQLPLVGYLEETGGGVRSFIAVLAFFLAHIPLALSMHAFTWVATLHALATLLAGLIWIALRQHEERAAYVAAYITGAEVLWRMNHANVFWEYGKYASVVILVFGMLRAGRLRPSFLPILYFALLLPSILLTADYLGLDEARKQLSFNLSGPFALMIAVIFFSGLKFQQQQLHRLLMIMVGPIVGILTLSVFKLSTVSALNFSAGSSNFAGSGGFGPNQVSAVLSMGALMCFF